MHSAIREVDDLLRANGPYALATRTVPVARLLAIVAIGGFIYGATMGSFAGRPLQALYSGLKVPLLLLLTSAIVLPNFFVLNTLLGLRDEFAGALRGVFAAQAVVAISLTALAPITIVGYASDVSYAGATRLNFLCFGLATHAGHLGCEKFYRPLVARDPRHQWARYAWTLLYVFVGIQLAWVFRPFVGDPRMTTAFIRDDAWSNAYVVVAHQVFGIGY